MTVPDGYVDALIDELAPLGFDFTSTEPVLEDEGGDSILFEADPLSFVQRYPGLGLAEAYGDDWPARRLDLWIKLDRHGEPYEIGFEIFDVLAWSASEDLGLHDRLNTLNDPADHAVAVGQALGRLLESPGEPADEFFA